MPTVWIPNENGQDFSASEKFGRMQVLTEGDVRHLSISEHWEQINMALQASTPDDYLVIVGPASIVAMVASVLMKKHGRLNMLLYGRRGSYRDFTVYAEDEEKIA